MKNLYVTDKRRTIRTEYVRNKLENGCLRCKYVTDNE